MLRVSEIVRSIRLEQAIEAGGGLVRNPTPNPMGLDDHGPTLLPPNATPEERERFRNAPTDPAPPFEEDDRLTILELPTDTQ